jgi:hypothetical protein
VTIPIPHTPMAARWTSEVLKFQEHHSGTEYLEQTCCAFVRGRGGELSYLVHIALSSQQPAAMVAKGGRASSSVPPAHGYCEGAEASLPRPSRCSPPQRHMSTAITTRSAHHTRCSRCDVQISTTCTGQPRGSSTYSRSKARSCR